MYGTRVKVVRDQLPNLAFSRHHGRRGEAFGQEFEQGPAENAQSQHLLDLRLHLVRVRGCLKQKERELGVAFRFLLSTPSLRLPPPPKTRPA